MAGRNASDQADSSATLVRSLGLGTATALNMIDMIGVGPFITIPLIISAAGGPQAMLGWILGAVLALCDGMVWAELGAAMPGSGGSYRYLKEIYGPARLGRLISFLFVWQLSFSAPLSIASGCLGLAQYTSYLLPFLEKTYLAPKVAWSLPGLGPLEARVLVSRATFVAIAACALAVLLQYRHVGVVGRLSKLLWVGVLATVVWVIVAGLTHFSSARAFDFPAGAFQFDKSFFAGLGSALLIATYDYWGYYNVCFLGGEVRDPARTIPRALVYSVLAVAAIYLVMNVSILGVVPWRELAAAGKTETRYYAVSLMMQRVYGNWAGYAVALLVIWTAFASVFSLLLGYSRVPYAAALDGNYFRVFGRVHSAARFPHLSLLALGIAAACFCLLRLADVIAALVVIRIVIQFLVQAVGLLILRTRRPEAPRPFRMWLYPLPVLAAIAGFFFVLISRQNFLKEVRYAGVILVAGLLIFSLRALARREWPFQSADI
ncbi:MAG TPA: APC family permease [Terriglobales bacterium]|nr:APC family permease [Terriglobales bacterium]